MNRNLLRKQLSFLLLVALLFTMALPATANASILGQNIIQSGLKYWGTPYQWGADPNQTATFDCSSFTKRAFQENGITLPRTSKEQYTLGASVSLADAVVGDLIFFQDPTYPGIPSHVGIYMGGNKMLNATVSKGVISVDVTTSYWQTRFLGVKRVLPKTHTIQSGDSLWVIASKYGVSIDQLRVWNKLSSDVLIIGKFLFVSNPDLTAAAKPELVKTHLVMPGDSLWSISMKYGVTTTQIQEWNHLSGTYIYAGQQLYVENPEKYYTVQSGDTLWGISQKTGISVTELMTANSLTSTSVYPGQVLILPIS